MAGFRCMNHRDPKGVTANCRWLSAATPPDDTSPRNTPSQRGGRGISETGWPTGTALTTSDLEGVSWSSGIPRGREESPNRECDPPDFFRILCWILVALLTTAATARADTKTWDGKHSTTQIEVTVVYFLPKDRPPLPDWKERGDYFADRITAFHTREFDGQSKLTTIVRPEPFRSARTTAQLRSGDANFIFFQTLQEVNDSLKFGAGEHQVFPILLVLSEINWKPLDDFYRLHSGPQGLVFEGNLNAGRHFPGAESGGARATYLADRGVGWGLVSADGWRVPYSGSDCVVYHEGVGHTVGLPHPDDSNRSVMSHGQYHGWISESYLDTDQKERLGWQVVDAAKNPGPSLFTVFRAVPASSVPRPGEEVLLKCDWPEGAKLESLRVQVQTDVWGPWHDILSSVNSDGAVPSMISLGTYDRPTPLSYRIDASTKGGQQVELWGYLQVRAKDDEPPVPAELTGDLALTSTNASQPNQPGVAKGQEIELLSLVDPEQDAVSGKWTKGQDGLTSPKAYGARIELPYSPPEEYDLTTIVEPLDDPNGLILGQRSGGQRFLVLLGYAAGETPQSAIENIDGKNVGNASTVAGPVFVKNRPAQVICSVRQTGVTVRVDGRVVIDWTGDSKQLGLGEYWETPHTETLFLGAYDCRYRVSRVTLTTVSGTGKPLR